MTFQASKKTDFTVDLIWWGSLKLAPTKLIAPNTKLLKNDPGVCGFSGGGSDIIWLMWSLVSA